MSSSVMRISSGMSLGYSWGRYYYICSRLYYAFRIGTSTASRAGLRDAVLILGQCGRVSHPLGERCSNAVTVSRHSLFSCGGSNCFLMFAACRALPG